MVPADYVVNATLATAWVTAQQKQQGKIENLEKEEKHRVEVYNYTSNEYSINWRKYYFRVKLDKFTLRKLQISQKLSKIFWKTKQK